VCLRCIMDLLMQVRWADARLVQQGFVNGLVWPITMLILFSEPGGSDVTCPLTFGAWTLRLLALTGVGYGHRKTKVT